jgi:FtsP/CotA-like multicopper oxidase with cupredoxin domain
MGALGPLEVLLNGEKWMSTTTEQPRVGDTEDWVIPNLTADTHPIHLHLVQFQLVSRQKFDAAKYLTAWNALNAAGSEMGNGMAPWLDSWTVQPLDVTPYLKGKVILPTPNEQGWKDTIQMNPGEVTVIRVRFAPQASATTGATAPSAGTNAYPFDPTAGPGYVWHCHIIDHEDNEMMRRYKVQP